MNIGSAGGGSSGLTLAPVHIILGFNGGGGTQIAGGASVTAAQGCPSCMGSFGRGGSTSSSYWLMAGGGGGWYGGGIGDSSGGGSGWVYTDATYNVWLAGNPTNAAGWQLNSAYYLTSAQTIAGNTAFLSPTGVSETGHTGSGYARITPLTAGLEVTFGGVPATNLMVAADGSSFSVVAPAHAAGTVDVVIDSGDGSPITLTNAYTYTSSFSVTHVNSDQGSTAGGETVTVVGTGFVDGSTSVEFGGETADCVFLSAAALSCETPPAAAAGAVDVVVDDGNSPVILAGGFNYTASGVGSPTGGGGTVTGGANSGASNSGATCAAGMAGLGVPNTGFEGLQFGQVTIPTKPTEFNKLVLK
jgi:hypothetical protein